MPPRQQQTHIDDLPSLCLQAILSRVGNAALPLRGSHMEIAHPLQCAVISRRWRSSAYLAVQSLTFKFATVTARHVRELRRFSSLTHLRLAGCQVSALEGFEAAAALLAESTPGLQCLELEPNMREISFAWSKGSPYEDTWTTALAKALPSWKHLRKLNMGDLHLEKDAEGFRLLFANLRTLPALESLTFGFSPELIGPHDLHSSPIFRQLRLLVGLKELHVSGYVVPTPSMIPTSALRTLYVVHADQLDNFASLGDLSQLRHIRLHACDSLTSLPPSLGKLSQLTHLRVEHCKFLTSVAPSPATLSQLQSLELACCLRLETLSEGLCSLPALAQLEISFAPSLSALPAGFGQLRSLASLTLSFCDHLETLGPLGGLQALKSLRIACCPLKRLPACIGQLARLEALDVRFCPLEKLPRTIGNVVSLLELDLVGCESLVRLTKQVTNLARLQTLNLCGCTALSRLPRHLGNLQSLKELSLSGCVALPELPESLSRITGLRKLHVTRITPEVALQRGVGAFLRLKELSLEASDSQEEPGLLLPPSLSQLSGLERLCVNGECLRKPTAKLFGALTTACQHMPNLRVLELHNAVPKLSDRLLRLTALKELKWATSEKSWSDSKEIVHLLAARGVKVTRRHSE